MKTIFTFIAFFLSLAMADAQKHANILSLKGIGGTGSDIYTSTVTRTFNNDFILCIESTSTSGPIDSICGTGDRLIFREYSEDGNTLKWTKCYSEKGDSFLIYPYPQKDGSIIIGGMFNSSASWGFLICKMDVSGNILWQKSYGKGNGSLLDCMMQCDDGGYIMGGRSYYTDSNVTVHYGSHFSEDMWVLKVDSNGDKVWSKVIGGSNNDDIQALVKAPNGGCYIVGGTLSNDYDCIGNHSVNGDAYLARLDSNGHILWHRDLGGSGPEIAFYACVDRKGGVLLGANSQSTDGDVHHHISPAGGSNYWAVEVDSSGNILWENCYGGAGNEYIHSICKAADGSVWMVGYTQGRDSFEVDTIYGRTDAYIVHADSAGNFISERVLGSSSYDDAYMVYPLPDNNVIVGGNYGKQDGSFASMPFYGSDDAFLAVFGPWPEQVNAVYKNDLGLDVYPNPATGRLTIKMSSTANEDFELRIMDISGRAVYEHTAETDKLNTVDVSQWASGTYFVAVSDREGRRYMQKVIVK